jgi:hypothetical protein
MKNIILLFTLASCTLINGMEGELTKLVSLKLEASKNSSGEESFYVLSAQERCELEEMRKREDEYAQQQRNAQVERAAELLKQREVQGKKYNSAVRNLIGELQTYNADKVENYLLQLTIIDQDDACKLWSTHCNTVLAVTKTARLRAKCAFKAWVTQHPVEGDPQQDHVLQNNAVNSLKNKWAINNYHAEHKNPITKN